MNGYIEKLSRTIVDYSLDVKNGERVLITYQSSEVNEFIKVLIKDIALKDGIPFIRLVDNEISSLLMEVTNEKRIEELVKHSLFDVNNYDAFINIRYSTNDYENALVDPKTRQKIGEATKEINAIRINKRKWVLLNYPSVLDAYKAKMPVDKFQKYAFETMTFDYLKMADDIKPLKKLMENTNQVRIVAPGTDLKFSIKGIPAVPCVGQFNIPDGEIFTAPVRDSVNGAITFNTPCPYQGYVYYDVKLTFEDGKIIDATARDNVEQLKEIFDTDEGSRYIGEFALGLNPLIKNPIGDILYDEKIQGSIHLTPGRAYEEAYNGNDSSVHWDMVLVQTKEYGGGEIYFDDKLIRKDGVFVIDELKHLNYEK